MFSKVIHKFYLIGAILGLLFLIGYVQLAFFLHNESQSALRAQKVVLIERDIRTLKEVFAEIRFWERAVFSQAQPEADREFGIRMERISKRIEMLQAQPIDEKINKGLGDVFLLLGRYEKQFNQIIQNMTEQRLGQTLFDSNYQSLISNVLRINSIDLLKPLLNLSHFQKGYLSNHRETEYQALKVVMGSLENKLRHKNLMDDRMEGYIENYKKILENDFFMEKETQKAFDQFDKISLNLANKFLYLSGIAENVLKKETLISEKLRTHLNRSFVISIVLGMISILFIFNLMARQIVNPIRGIVAVVQKVKSGYKGVRFVAKKNSKDEVGQLGLNLNDMLDTIEKNNEQLVTYQEKLEDKVNELEATQKELVDKALEAGRAQLSAMVLHNIGNAITPVRVYVEGMKSDELARISAYLEKCYKDLCEHTGELNRYVSDDARGKEVFAFMGTLFDSLKTYTDQTADAVDKIDKSVSHISDILTLQHSYVAREIGMKEMADLNQIIDDAVKMQEGSLEKGGVHLERSLEANLPQLCIDKSRLVQVLVNLIKNSYESIKQLADQNQEKRIMLKSFYEGGRIGFEINDTGAGIAPDEIASIGELGNSHKDSSGFGLYYSKAFIEANNGELTVSSPGKEKGATVKIIFTLKNQREYENA